MSNIFLPRKPAWSSINPSLPTFKEVSPSLASDIQRIMGDKGRVLKMNTDDGIPEGYYRFESLHNSKSLFLKIISREYAPYQRRAEEVARFLEGRDVRVNAALPSFPRELNRRWVIFAYNYVPMRFAGNDHEDMRKIGRVLAQMHTALLDIPFVEDIKNASLQKTEMLLRCKLKLSKENLRFAGNREKVENIIEETPVTFDGISGVMQVIHGDFNYGNLIFSKDTSEPVVLDFEDTLHSWLPPVVDIALAVERFSFVRVEDEERVVDLALSLIKKYEELTMRIIVDRHGILKEALRILSARSLCLLSEQSIRGNRMPDSEWDKFIYLYEQTSFRSRVFDKIESALISGN